MTGFLLDTHVWLWHLIGSDRLPAGLRTIIDGSPDACRLSPVSVWELGLLVERGRFQVDGSLRAFVRDAAGSLPIAETPLTHEVAVTSHELELGHRDPADRLLASTAMVYDLTLLTVDTRLTSLTWLPTRSN